MYNIKMPIDKSNNCGDYLRNKININNFNNLKYSNKFGKINKINLEKLIK